MRNRILIALAISPLLVSCGPSRSPTPPTPSTPPPVVVPVEPEPVGPVQVALLVPLSGRAGDVGQDLLNAAQLALHSVGPTDMVLLPMDTQSTTQGALAAARQAIDMDAELILGPLFGAATAAIAPLARDAGIAVISFSNDASVAGEGIYVTGYRPEEQVERVVEFAQREGYFQIAALGPANPYGERAINAWRSAGARGSEPATTEFGTGQPVTSGNAASFPGRANQLYRLYAPNENGMAGSVRELADYDRRKAERDREFARVENLEDAQSRARKAELETLDTLGEPPFDSLLVADGGDRLRSVAALLSYYDVDPQQVQLLGTMQWAGDPQVLRDPGLDWAWLAAPNPAEQEAFASNFTYYFDRTPHALAGLAYDVTVMAVEIAKIDREFPETLLTDPAGFAGHAGNFRFLPDGEAEHGLAIVELEQGRTVLLEAAPRGFSDSFLSQ